MSKLYRIASPFGARCRSAGIGFRQNLPHEKTGVAVGLFIEGHKIGRGRFWHSLYESPIIIRPMEDVTMYLHMEHGAYRLTVWQSGELVGEVVSPQCQTAWYGVGLHSMPYYGGVLPASLDVKIALEHAFLL